MNHCVTDYLFFLHVRHIYLDLGMIVCSMYVVLLQQVIYLLSTQDTLILDTVVPQLPL